jgi:hypothetical protein
LPTHQPITRSMYRFPDLSVTKLPTASETWIGMDTGLPARYFLYTALMILNKFNNLPARPERRATTGVPGGLFK